IAAEHVHHFHTGGVFAWLWILLESGITRCFERAIFARSIILPVMFERLAFVPVEIDSPEIDEIESALCHMVVSLVRRVVLLPWEFVCRAGSSRDRLPASARL